MLKLLLVSALIVSSCSTPKISSNGGGGNGTGNGTNGAATTPSPTASANKQTAGSRISTNANPPRILPTPAPRVDPLPFKPAQPKPTSTPSPADPAGSTLSIFVVAFLNQVNGVQIIGDRNVVQIFQNNELLVSGKLNTFAYMNGEAVDSSSNGAFNHVYAIKPEISFISERAKSLSGDQKVNISMCLASDINASITQPVTCASLGTNTSHSNGVNQIVNAPAVANFNSGNVSVKSINAGSYGSCSGSNGMPCVSLGHSALVGGVAFAGQTDLDGGSPLVLDLSKGSNMDVKKLSLLSVWDSFKIVKFDLTGSNQLTRTGWIGKNAGLLALDLDGDNKISSGRELFGEYSARAQGENKNLKTFDQGFAALAQYDTKNLGYIDESNEIFSKLRVWTDMNQNGVSEKSELKTMKDLKIKKISLGYTEVAAKDQTVRDNKVKYQSTYETTDGKKHLIADVFFSVRPYKTVNEIIGQK